jgi:7-keto-8-aminopelargonate synthetase-like enzyme
MPSSGPALSAAELRTTQKELTAIDRKLSKLASRIARDKEALADHDQSDYLGLAEKMKAINAMEDEHAELEARWLELAERIE